MIQYPLPIQGIDFDELVIDNVMAALGNPPFNGETFRLILLGFLLKYCEKCSQSTMFSQV